MMVTTIYYHGEAYELAQVTAMLPVDIEQLSLPHIKHIQMANYEPSYCVVDNQLFLRDALRIESNGADGEVHFAPVQRLPFTGKLLLVRDFFQQNVVVKGKVPFRRIEGYEKIIELVFEEGYLTCALDHSATINALRGIAHNWRNAESELDFLTNLNQWVQAIYGYEYDVWWLPSAA
jgi:hypothetical protein